MSDWNFDMGKAPRGSVRTVSRTIGKNTVEAEEFIPDMIIAAGDCGVVTASRWLPKEGRWNMFAKAEQPLAWMPWPSHPSEGQS